MFDRKCIFKMKLIDKNSENNRNNNIQNITKVINLYDGDNIYINTDDKPILIDRMFSAYLELKPSDFLLDV